MKTWNETAEVLAAAQAALAEGLSCAIVVLTAVRGSSFRRPGAKLLVRADGRMSGNVSGGCLEQDVVERAKTAMASGEQVVVHYNTGSDEDVIWGLGLGCDGELDLLVVPLRAGARHAWLDSAQAKLAGEEPFGMMWQAINGPAQPPVIMDAHEENDPPAREIYRELLEPPPVLMVVGAGDDAIPLVAQAAAAGMRVTVVDHRPGYLDASRFPRAHAILQRRPDRAASLLPVSSRTMVVIKNHALSIDKAWARFFDGTDARYIGILGPKKRGAEIIANMTSGRMDRVFNPAGLDIGGEGADQIATSVVAELLAVWSGRHPGHLRNRQGPIHG